MAEIMAGIGKGVQTVLSSYNVKESAKADRRLAEARMQAADFEAKMLEERAGQEIAVAQRLALEENRKAELVASRAIAVAAASGGGASDSTVVNLVARLKGEGAYRAAAQLYEGESRARLMKIGATAKRYEGAQGVVEAARGQKVANNMAFLNLMAGGGTLASKYGGNTASGTGTGMQSGVGMGTSDPW